MISPYVTSEIKKHVSQILKKDLPKLVEKEVKLQLRHGSSIQATAETILHNGASLRNKAAIQASDTYGRIVIDPAQEVYGNGSLYDRMKNKIQYGVNLDKVGLNRGKYRILR